MSTATIHSLDQARQYARKTTCSGCQKTGMLAAYEVHKEGPNQGRLFVKCRHCGSFQWLTAAATTDEALERAESSAGPCPKCGKKRRAQRVRKDGPNRDRLFLTCADPTCDSFAWASPAAHPPSEAAPRPVPTTAQLTEEGLLADIREHPDDDSLRMIYADWLDEHEQQPRAEFIRLQLEDARRATGDPARADLQQRAQAILAENEAVWVGPLRSLVRSYYHVRGLIDEVEVEVGPFVAHAGELLRLAPTAVIRVHVDGWQDVKSLIACKELSRVSRLALLGGRMGRAGMQILAESPRIASLKELSLAGQSLGQPGTAVLAGSRYIGNLEVLDLTANNLARSAIPLLVSSPKLSRLRRLVLAENMLVDSDVRALAVSPHLSELRALDLSHNPIGNEALEALARSPLLAHLRRLDLFGCPVSIGGIAAVHQAPQAHKDLVVQWKEE